MFYVYEWFIKDTGEIFYVGKGCGRRYKVRKHNRNFNQVIKIYDCDSRIIKEFENEKDAFEYEYQRILELKEQGQCVCNNIDGGTGGVTTWWTPERRKEWSENNIMKSQTQRERMSLDNPMRYKEVAKKQSEKLKRKVVINGIVYPGVKDAAEDLCVCSNTISNWCKRGYNTDGQPCRYFDESQKEYPDIKKTHPKTTNAKAVIIDGIRYNTVKDAAKAIEGNSEGIIRAIKGKRPYKGHECRYDNQQPSCEKSDNSITEGSTTNE